MKLILRYSYLFWAIYVGLISYFLSLSGDINTIFLRVILFVLPQACMFYINLLYLSPKYLEQGKKSSYFASLFFSVMLFVVLFGLMDYYAIKHLPLKYERIHEHPVIFIFVGRLMSLVPPILIGALIRKSILLQRKTEESLELQNKMLAAETKALKAQINPHFLFNTLNNIYSLSQFNSAKTGDAILQLSDILRYVTYEGNQKLVNLNSELEHINSFIELQLLRDADHSNISYETDVPKNNLKIAPLILIPFIENCFKHGNHHDKQNGWIQISIKTDGTLLTLEAANSTTNEIHQKDKVGGVGMENVRKRLALLYGDDHSLVLTMDKFQYKAKLTINLSHEMHNY